MEISIILDNKVVYSKEFENYIKRLKERKPDDKLMKEMEAKFLNLVNTDKKVNYLYKIASGVAVGTMTNTVCYAGDLSSVITKIRTITNPVIELLAALGYPVTNGMLIAGFLMIITGRKSKGLEVIKWACFGYIGLQFAPFLLGLLEVIGHELRSSL